MIKCEVIKEFTLRDFDKLTNIVRKSIDEKGKLFVGDAFECDETMYKYLTGDNPNNDIVVQLIEIIPEEKKEVDTKKIAKNIINATKAVKLGKQIKSKIEKK